MVVAASLFLACLAAAPVQAASFLYVDRSNPNCADSGSGTSTQPFCTIRAAASAVKPGQTVAVASGTYAENVVVQVSGTSTAPIVFRAAAGANVVLKGQSNGFSIAGRGWITVSGFNVTKTSGNGILVSSSSHITVAGNHVSYSGQQASGKTRSGILLRDVDDSVVSGNKVDHNTYAGIELNNGSTRNLVTGNEAYANARGFERAAPGIRLYGAPGNKVARNVTHDNEDSGIEAYPGSNNTLIFDNISYRNGDHGIDNYGTTGERIVANTVYKNVTAGINVEGHSTGATIANNISVDNGIKSPRTHSNIRVERGSTWGTTMDFNLVHLSVSDTLLIWSSTSYKSLSAFQKATGQEAHGIAADPRWQAPSSGDFHLLPGSPAIDSAGSGVSGHPDADIDGNPRVDDPPTPNSGAGPRSYDDRGAREFQPAADQPPAAAVAATPSSGPGPLTVAVDASGSTDRDATPIASYVFDFGDGSAPVGPQTSPRTSHTYTGAGSYTLTVTVTDVAGLFSTASTVIAVAGPGNLVGNSGFEANLEGWNTSGSGSGVTLGRVAGGHSGGWAARLTNTGGANATCALNDAPNWVESSVAGTYTGRVWVRADVAGATIKLRLREYSGDDQLGSSTASATLSTSWQPVTVAYAVTSPGSTLDLNAFLSSADAPPGTCFYADDIAITVS